MISYKVSFFKLAKEDAPEEKDEFLGHVVVDECGVGANLTLAAKAFRQCSPSCLLANKVIIERVSNYSRHQP